MDSLPNDLPDQPSYKPAAGSRPLPNVMNGLKYPANRPPFYALKYLRMLIKTCAMIDIDADGYALCSLVALTEDSKRYTEEPRFWTKALMDHLGIKTRATLCEIRNKCVKKGVLHYEPGRKGVACVMWTLWPMCWDKLTDGFLDAGDVGSENAVQNLNSILSESLQQSVTIPSEHRTHSYPSRSTTPTTDPGVGTGADDCKDLVLRLRELGLKKAKQTIYDALRKGLTRSYITSVMDHYESLPGAWNDAGVIRWRLLDDDAIDFPPVEGWPTPNIAVVQDAKVQRMIQADRLKTQADAQSSTERKLRERQLELQFGSILDALPSDELIRIVSERKPHLLPTVQRYGAGSKMCRVSLLGLLAEAAEPPR